MRTASVGEILGGVEEHPHALAVLGPALPPEGRPSHAYLFHGPRGTGKAAIARAFAGELLADGAADPGAVKGRVARDVHPDLTWVRPSGAAEMLVGDVAEAVVGAAARTPLESRRRVFVLEGADLLNEEAGNRLLKTLEEPPSFVHLILLAERPEDVLPTIASRCQRVRFDPLSRERVVALLREGVPSGAPSGEGERLEACARLGLGDAELAGLLASPRGMALREQAEGFVRAALAQRTGGRAWLALLAAAAEAGGEAGGAVEERLGEEAELLPQKERRRHEREGAEARRRAERRARTGTLALGLRLAELWLRDAWCVAEGTPELVHAVDRLAELRETAAHGGATLRRGVELVAETRLRLAQNVSEELALEALAYRLHALAAGHPAGAL